MTKWMHPFAGAIAILSIGAFWLSTALVEVFGTREAIVAVKSAIP